MYANQLELSISLELTKSYKDYNISVWSLTTSLLQRLSTSTVLNNLKQGNRRYQTSPAVCNSTGLILP